MNIQKEKEELQKTRKGNTMTRIEALNAAINSTNDNEVKDILSKMAAQLAKPRNVSDEAKAARSAKQKEAVEAAGFYFSAQLGSWNKKLTCKAHRAAVALAATLTSLS